MNENSLVPLVGYPYFVNISERAVFGRGGRRLKPHYGTGSQCPLFDLHKNGVSRRISRNRIMFSALRGIDPDLIPKDVYVVEEDGHFHLMNRKDHCHRFLRQNNLLPMAEWRSALERRKTETDILLRYAETGDPRELVEYMLGQHDRLVLHARAKYLVSRQKAHDVVAQAIEEQIDLAVRHQTRSMTITPKLYWCIHDCLKSRKRETQFFEDKGYVKILQK